MQLAKYPRGREHARSIDATPVRHPHGSDHLATEAAPHGFEPGPVIDTEWIGWKVTDALGRTVGRVEGTLQPDWLIIRDRRGHHFLAPATEAIAGGSSVFLPYDQELITQAPEVDGEEVPDPETLALARRHYRVNRFRAA